MKKILSVIISICLAFATITSAYAFNPASSSQSGLQNTKIDFLVGVGLSLDFLDQRTSNEIDALFDLAQTHSLQFFSYQAGYSEGTSSTFGTIPASDMILQPSVITATSPAVPGHPSRLDSVWVYIDYKWNPGHPLVRWEDAITVNWDSSLFQFTTQSSQFSSADYVTYGSGIEATVNRQTNPAHLNSGGLGYYVKLSEISTGPLQFRGSASFILEAKDTIYAGNDKTTTISFEYTHNKNPMGPLGGGISFSDRGVSVSVSLGGYTDSVAKSSQMRYGSVKN